MPYANGYIVAIVAIAYIQAHQFHSWKNNIVSDLYALQVFLYWSFQHLWLLNDNPKKLEIQKPPKWGHVILFIQNFYEPVTQGKDFTMSRN